MISFSREKLLFGTTKMIFRLLATQSHLQQLNLKRSRGEFNINNNKFNKIPISDPSLTTPISEGLSIKCPTEDMSRLRKLSLRIHSQFNPIGSLSMSYRGNSLKKRQCLLLNSRLYARVERCGTIMKYWIK